MTANDTSHTPAATTEAPTLAVVSATAPIALWHVELSPTFGSNRLSGAWLVDPLADDASAKLTNLFSNCSVVLVGEHTRDAGDAAAEGSAENSTEDSLLELINTAREQAGASLVDLDKTVAGIGAHIKELRAQVKEEKAKPGKSNLTAPRFPKIDTFEPIEFAHTGEEVASEVLAVARGVEKLVAQWGEVESQRLRRKYLNEPWGDQARQIPLAL